MENKSRKDHLQAVWFAAGMAIVIACVERAVVVSIFKQLHMWVFLALNLLLIAILFTSTHPPRTHSNPSPKSQESHKKQPPPVTNHADDVVDDRANVVNELNQSNEEKEESYFADEDNDDDDEKLSGLLSNEELNERVEAFISRFRQQYLVSDVKIRRSSSDDVCGRAVFSKTITV
ncbi:hypothetical protein HanXRQr2_Chr09g0402241 [Helianthus annuus]|uniref:DUF4408 domain-containing protein n=1 Tax=Helianthus annuus TaxID=4232 RepID=A0A9K3I8Z2_HELAN|nr:uncharacterized protein LOC110876621 [Helianthus annuus]KAF5792100.1 hypothetical protein HanXRQr2_Chr09g0402241 [Helianthus annuus]